MVLQKEVTLRYMLQIQQHWIAGYAKKEKMDAPVNAIFVFKLTTIKMTNHEMIAFAVKGYLGKELTTQEIKEIVLKAFPNFNEGSLLPNDHATGNKCPCPCAGTNTRIFDKIERARYLVR